MLLQPLFFWSFSDSVYNARLALDDLEILCKYELKSFKIESEIGKE